MATLDPHTVLMLLERGSHPRSTVDSLVQASRQLRLPVNIDRRLYELTRGGLDPREIVLRLTDYVRALLR